METPRRIPIHRSLHRPTLLLGCDRELLLCAGLVAGVLVFSIMTWWAVVVGVGLWLGAFAALSRMGKADPLMRPVLIRHQRYQSYYPAASRWSARDRVVPSNWKGQ